MSNYPARATDCTALSSSVLDLAPKGALIRVFAISRAVTHIYAEDFQRILMDRGVEEEVAKLIRKHFSSVADWRYSHDFHVPTGRLYVTPDAVRVGYIPEDDKSFGMSPARYIATADGGDQ